jgi:hypothetical protein
MKGGISHGKLFRASKEARGWNPYWESLVDVYATQRVVWVAPEMPMECIRVFILSQAFWKPPMHGGLLSWPEPSAFLRAASGGTRSLAEAGLHCDKSCKPSIVLRTG